jgi:lipopolysaccharide transport system permease protein
MNVLHALWTYRGFILGSVKREFQLKYRNSILGSAWTVLNPLAMILVYTLIFSQIMKAKLPGIEHGFAYSIFLCSGLLTWGLFSEVISRGQNVFLENANLLKKLNFPRITLPVIVLLNAGLNFAIIFSIFLLFLLIFGLWPGWVIVATIPALAVQLILSIGLGVTLGVLNVFFRDVGQFFGIFLQFWFWLTPIIYPASILPEAFKPLLQLNPMVAPIGTYQDIFVGNRWPDWSALAYPLILGSILFVIGFSLLKKKSGEMVDDL